MRPHPSSPEHQAALSRRLALLGDELAAVRPPPEADSVGEGGAVVLGAHSGGPPRPWWDEHTRLSEGSRQALAAVGDETARADPPAPGRHAARRAPAHGDRGLGGEGWSSARPGSEPGLGRGRLLLGPAQLAVVAVVVMMALGVTCWWLARARPTDTVQLQAAPAAGLTAAPHVSAGAGQDAADAAGHRADAVPVSASGASPSSGSAAGVTAGTVTVDVSGRVRHPGIQVLPGGARVADALRAAGGARPGVDLTALNLAQVLVDGQQVLVGATSGDSSSVTGGGSTSTSAPSAGASTAPVQVVDLNTASADQLDTLPDVGPVTAQSILSWREAHGRFSSVDELLEVDGIGEVTLGRLAPYVTV